MENCFGTCNVLGNDAGFEGLPEQPRYINNNAISDRSYLVYKENKDSTGYNRKKFWDKIIEYNKEKIDLEKTNLTKTRHDSNHTKSAKAHNRLENDPEYLSRLNKLIGSHESQNGQVQKAYSKLVNHSRTRRSTFKLGLNQGEVMIVFPLKSNRIDGIWPNPYHMGLLQHLHYDSCAVLDCLLLLNSWGHDIVILLLILIIF